MSLLNVKDRIPVNVLSNKAIRYGVYDENNNLLRYEYIKREDEPLEEGTPVNKVLFDTIETNAMGYNILDNYTEISGNRNFIIDNINTPKRGQVLKTWFDSKTMAKIEVNPSVASYNDGCACAELNNGNVFLAWRCSTSTAGGQIGIYKKDGTKVMTTNLGTSDNTGWSIVSIAVLKNGNVAVAYKVPGKSWQAFYRVFNENGGTVKDQTSLLAAETYSIKTIALENGNFMVLLTYNAKVFMYIYDSVGNVVKGQTEIASSTSTSHLAYCILPDKSIAVVFYGGTNNHFMKLDQEGNVIMQAKPYTGAATVYNSCAVTKSGNIFVTGSAGYSILDQEGNVIKELTALQHTTNASQYVNTIALKNGNIMVVYGGIGIEVYTEDGVYITGGNSNYTGVSGSDASACLLESGAVAVFYLGKKTSNSNQYSHYFMQVNEYAKTPVNLNAGLSSNSVNDIPIDTLLKTGFYELLYDNGKYFAKELRV